MRFKPLLIATLLSIPFFTFAQNNNGDCIDMHVIQSYPIGYLREDGSISGAHAEILDRIALYSGLCINKILMPYARLWRSIELGNHDGGLVFKSNERSHLVYYIAQTQLAITGVVSRPNKPMLEFNDLYGMNIGLMRGAKFNDRFDNDKLIRRVEVTNYDHASKMLAMGRIDAVTGGMEMLEFQIAKHPKLSALLKPQNYFQLGTREQWLQMSKHTKHTAKFQHLREAIDKMVGLGEGESIRKKYYDER